MFTSPRKKVHQDVIPFPETKSAGASTLNSNELYDFEGSAYGPVNLHLTADDDSNITDNLDVKLQVSWDGGSTWIDAVEYTGDLANGAGNPISSFKNSALDYAPRVRVQGVFDATGALASGHGAEVHAEMTEHEPTLTRNITMDVDDLGDTLGTGTTVNGSTVELQNSSNDSLASAVDKLVVIVKADDLSTVTDNITYMLQCSYDGNHWWDMWSSAQTDVANGTGFFYAEHEMDSGMVVGNYARVNFTTDGTGALASGHGIAAHLLELYR